MNFVGFFLLLLLVCWFVFLFPFGLDPGTKGQNWDLCNILSSTFDLREFMHPLGAYLNGTWFSSRMDRLTGAVLSD